MDPNNSMIVGRAGGSGSSKLHSLIEARRARLAELEAAYTIDKARVDSLQASLFKHLRLRSQERDQLRLVVNHRKQYLESVRREPNSDFAKFQKEFGQAKARMEREYEETAQAFDSRRELSKDEQLELHQLWRKLVVLYHPDRFAHQPDKLETYGKLTAAINRAKDSGDIEILRQIAGDPHGFILRQGWTGLDFREEEQIGHLKKLLESLEREIARVQEASKKLRNGPEFELYELTAKTPEMFDKILAGQSESLENEIAALRKEADSLAKEIANLANEPISEE